MAPAAPLLDDMVLLVEVVAARGLSAAAERLHLRKSTVSRRLAALEARLGVRLLERNSRNLRLTEAGREYHAHAARLVAEARAANRTASAGRGTPQGTLRVAAPELLGELLTPAVAGLLAAFPGLRVELALARGHVDLVAEEVDVALRTGPLPDSGLVARRLGRLRTGHYASPTYLARRGTPRTPDDLAGHACVVVAEAGSDEIWFFGEGKGARTLPVEGRLRVSSLRAGQAAARAGLGLVRLPAALAEEDVRAGTLVAVLEAHATPGLPVFAVLPSRQLPPKVRAFLDLLAAPATPVPWEREAGR